ncbi:MAG: hypothetical protein IOC88_13085 [Rhodobacter sp.]|nr:hypothetical protein [Rhodobacter sp.]
MGTLAGVLILLVIHGPEGFVHPMLTAMLSRAVPEDAQGELQGGLSSVMNIAMLLGTVVFSQIFGHFMQPDAFIQSPDVAMYVAAAVLVLALALFVATARAHSQDRTRGAD